MRPAEIEIAAVLWSDDGGGQKEARRKDGLGRRRRGTPRVFASDLSLHARRMLSSMLLYVHRRS